MSDTIRVAQLSDTHFLEDGADPEGGYAYDTDAAFEAVRADLIERGPFDLVAVTGDVADHGRPAQYRKAAAAFARLDSPVNACPGNHDFVAPFTAGIGRPEVATSRVIEIGNWAFVFIDSSSGMMEADASGLLTDPAGEARLHTNGSMGAREMAWLRQTHDAIGVDHVFIWLHHPPGPPLPLTYDEAYAQQWDVLLADLPKVRGLGAGHTHVPDAYEFAGRAVFVCSSFKNNFSMEPATWLPPGYRTYDFHPDGSVESVVHEVGEETWPRRPFGRALKSLFMGEITYDELRAIAARKAAGSQSLGPA